MQSAEQWNEARLCVSNDSLTQTVLGMNLVSALQWPAMLITVVAAWLVASQLKRRRRLGFWAYLGGNVLWVIWGLSTDAYALVALQVALAALNVRGAGKNDPD